MSSPSIDFYNDAVDAVQAGKLDDGLKAIENSLTEDPKDAQSWQLYAVILNALGQSEKAANALAKVKELGLSEVDELLMKAADAAAAGKAEVAITHYEDALELDGSRGEIYTSYSLVLMEGGYPKDAQEAAAKAVELLPEDAPAWYAQGRILRLRGQKPQALEALTKATQLDGDLVLAQYERGMLLVENGDLDEALACFESVLSRNPMDQGATQAKAQIIALKEQGSSNMD